METTLKSDHDDQIAKDNRVIHETFPGSHIIVAVEGTIVQHGDKCLKVYNRSLKPETIKEYADSTNSLASKVNGKVVEVEFPDGTKKEYTVEIVKVNHQDLMPDGRVYTENKYHGGFSLQKILDAAVTASSTFSPIYPPESFKKLYKHEGLGSAAIEASLTNILEKNATDKEKRSIKINADNIKIEENGDRSVLIVTDLSQRIFSLQD